ncbi:GGDEF domain-containing protein [Nocardia stercoris]|uniref:GGDEF domain-containing protein n=2 Tax=Nocardia stercoris TaxID=2483361 RepID=A0A3M2KWU4_9NOCA|nr:GGDEF domain-containing protein [Nocardia stercoris]
MIGQETTGWQTVTAWWRDRLDYRWLTRTLDARGALAVMKGGVAVGGAALLVFSALNLESADGPVGAWRLVTMFNIAATLTWVFYWSLAPWPGERTSLILMAFADVMITGVCLVESNRLFGAFGLLQLVIPGSYLAIFHGPRVLAVHGMWSVLSILILTWLMMRDADSATTVSIVLTMASVAVLVLPALHFCYWVLRMDALTDPLTGLLNRRGLDYYVSSWFEPGTHDSIALMTIDLDRFKQVNDMYGHRAGDRVLARTAACLLEARPQAAVVTRSGGEEFVVLAPLTARVAVSEAERLCQAIESAVEPVTASIGVAVASDSTSRDAEQLLRSSDSAMYQAKQLGGNTVVLAT